MSLYDDASLALLTGAGAGKDGKLYVAKPTDGSGDFTFSRGSNLSATRVGPTGLIEKGRENLLLRSNAFDTSPWTNYLIDTPTSGQTGYDGNNDAWLVQCANTSNFPGASQAVSSSGVNVLSFYAKAGNVDYVGAHITDGSQGNINFELTGSGSVGSVWNSGLFGEIERVGTSDWYRCSFVFNGNLTNVRIGPRSSISSFNSAVGDNIYIQDAQLEVGLAATDYIESGASTGKAGLLENEPRFDYSGGATCPSLLLEPQRVNLVPQSEYYGSNLFVNSSPEINNTTSPEGVQNATLLKEDTNSGNHAMREPSNISIAADDSQYVISFFAKSNGRNIRFIDDGYAGSGTIVNFNLSSGGTFSNGAAVIDSDAVAIGTDGWYRCYAVIDKASAAQSGFRFSLRLLGGASNDNDSYTGDGTSGVWIYGKEVNDAVTYPTSYIPNHSGGSATRTQELCELSTGGVNETKGTFFIDYGDSPNVNALFASSTSHNTITNNIRLSKAQLYIRNGGGNLIIASVTLPDSGKLALKYSTSGVKIFANGGSTPIYESATSITFDGPIDYVRVGSRVNDSSVEEFRPKQFLIFPEALTDVECIKLTEL